MSTPDMPTQEQIETRVIATIAKSQHIPLETVTADSTFVQMNIDSLDGLQILFALEEEFGIDIPDDAGKQITSVGEAVAGVSQLLARKASASTVVPQPSGSQPVE